MLKPIEEFAKYMAITGFKNVKIKDVEEFLEKINREKPASVDVQFFDAELVATWQHLYFAVLNALTAFKNKQNISKTLAIEIMLYASAQRQIRKAMELIGIKPNLSKIAVIAVGEDPETVKTAVSTVLKHANAKQDDGVLELTDAKMKEVQRVFGISDVEIETVAEGDDLKGALVDLVIERMALLSVQH
ncbi:MAG: KEOPS complex subunit Cgi121 [Candidatus Bathyarchaeales archaeon]